MRAERACTFCGESILVAAKKCKHCGSWIEVSEAGSTPPPPRDTAPVRTVLPAASSRRTSSVVLPLVLVVLAFAAISSGTGGGWFGSGASRAVRSDTVTVTDTVVRPAYEMIVERLSAGQVLAEADLSMLGEGELRRLESFVLAGAVRTTVDSANLEVVRQVGRRAGLLWPADSPDSVCVGAESAFACGRRKEQRLVLSGVSGVNRVGGELRIPLLNGELLTLRDDANGGPSVRSYAAVRSLATLRLIEVEVYEGEGVSALLIDNATGWRTSSPGPLEISPDSSWLVAASQSAAYPQVLLFRRQADSLSIAFEFKAREPEGWGAGGLRWVGNDQIVISRRSLEFGDTLPRKFLVRSGDEWVLSDRPKDPDR